MKWVYSLLYLFITFFFTASMIPVLEVTPMVQSFPQESQTSKETGVSSFQNCL